MIRDLSRADVTALVDVFDRNRHHGIQAALKAVIGAYRRASVPRSHLLTEAIQQIIAEVARIHGIEVAWIMSHNRLPVVVVARFECYWRLRRLNQSYPAIGKITNRHHSSVIGGVRSFERRLAADPILRARVGVGVVVSVAEAVAA